MDVLGHGVPETDLAHLTSDEQYASRSADAAQELAARLASFPQTCLRSDRASMLDQEGLDEAAALASEFAHGRQALASEAGSGAARFAADAGRHGSFGT